MTSPSAAQSRAWRALVAHREKSRAISPQDLFAADSRRFETLSFALDDLLLDLSKTALTEETIDLLADLAAAADLPARREAMFAGEAVNESEDRAVLHTALRADPQTEVWRGGENAVAVAAAARADALDFAEKCRSGEIATAAGEQFSDVVNIGIGGSDLGPAMAAAALAPHCDGPRARFVSNLDGAHLADTLAALDPRRTLLVVSSKTFTTIETLTNARAAIEWLARGVGRAAAAAHWVAVTAAPAQARAFGARRVFEYRDWVGGRCSLWGAVGLPVAVAVGRARFEEFLAGARALDAHFRAAPIRRNLPALLGLLGVWHRNFCAYPTRAVLPYDWRLRLLPSYLQQLDMESNGKRVGLSGAAVECATAPVVWGAPGTDAQHAFFQMLHQGTDIVPCEFVLAARPSAADDAQHRMLAANCLAQSAALFFGDDSPSSPPHRRCPGGRPSATILQRQLTPFALGRLVALFEHRTFVEGTIWGVNSFDQWGVELGKRMAREVEAKIDSKDAAEDGDGSTRGLLRRFGELRAD